MYTKGRDYMKLEKLSSRDRRGTENPLHAEVSSFLVFLLFATFAGISCSRQDPYLQTLLSKNGIAGSSTPLFVGFVSLFEHDPRGCGPDPCGIWTRQVHLALFCRRHLYQDLYGRVDSKHLGRESFGKRIPVSSKTRLSRCSVKEPSFSLLFPGSVCSSFSSNVIYSTKEADCVCGPTSGCSLNFLFLPNRGPN